MNKTNKKNLNEVYNCCMSGICK